jgi:hypothetical protein
MDWVAKVYSVADALAIRYANLSLSLWLAVFFLAAISGIALAMQDCAKQGDRVFLIVYGGCFAAALLLISLERGDCSLVRSIDLALRSKRVLYHKGSCY